MHRFGGQYLFTGSKFIKNGFVETDDSGTVLDVGSLGDAIRERAQTEFFNGIIAPGFVNAHCHLELSYLRGLIPENSGMTGFLKNVMSMKERQPPRETLLSAIADADAEMEREGIVAVGDISNTADSLETKRRSRLKYCTFVETLGLNPATADAAFQQAQTVCRRFVEAGLTASISPHAPYSMSEPLFARSFEADAISIHNQESDDENELFARKCGKMHDLFGEMTDLFLARYNTPLQRTLKYVAPETRLMLVHNVCSTCNDLNEVAKRNRQTTWTLCPGSNLYIGNGLPDADIFAASNVSVALGTDSLSSNTGLSILNELKILSRYFPSLSLGILLRWATLNGAGSLGFHDELGSFDIGKRPGVLLLTDVDMRNLRLKDTTEVERLR
jgi:cytosine/adenosine deaminase-related metal-dependent hydrolase